MPRPLEPRTHLIDLSAKVMFAKSDLLDLLIKSKVYKYLEFKPLGSFHTFENDSFEKVAGSKEDIFTDQSLPLITKRKLMKFIKFVLEWEIQTAIWEPYQNGSLVVLMKEKFDLEESQITELIVTIGLCSDLSVSVIEGLVRIKRYLVSIDIYGSFPVLYSMYGGAGEVAQGFCRSAAVAGATYKLNSKLVAFDESTKIATFSDGSRVQVSEKVVISPNDETHLNKAGHVVATSGSITRMIAIVAKDCVRWFAENESAAIVIFPPRSLPSNNRCAVQVIVLGSGSGECPEGQAIWYLSTTEAGPKAQSELEEALGKMELSILRESTEDFELEGIDESDIAYRADGLPVISSVKLGKSMQNFVPKEKLQYLLKLCFTQSLDAADELEQSSSNIIYSYHPSAEISYDGIVGQARTLYAKIVGSDDDFFDVDFEDDEEPSQAVRDTSNVDERRKSSVGGQMVGGEDIDMEF